MVVGMLYNQRSRNVDDTGVVVIVAPFFFHERERRNKDREDEMAVRESSVLSASPVSELINYLLSSRRI